MLKFVWRTNFVKMVITLKRDNGHENLVQLILQSFIVIIFKYSKALLPCINMYMGFEETKLSLA